MTTAILFLQLLLLGTPIQEKGPDQLISIHTRNAAFSDFCQQIQQESGVKVFFRESWVKQLKVTIDADSISVLNAVRMAVAGTGLKVSVWHRDLVISARDNLLSRLPDFEQPENKANPGNDKSAALTRSEDRYITGRKSDVTQLIRIGKPGLTKKGAKASVLGKVIDEDSGEPAIGATMFVEETKTGAATDANGFLNMVLLPGVYNVSFEFVGLEKKKYQLEVFSDGDFTVSLKRAIIQMQEVVVHGDRQMNIKLKDPGLEKLSIKTLKSIPMLMGERDVLKVSQTLPGIVSVGEGSAGLNVRGGSSDQNAFYINKIPIYNTSHLFGFFPAFNSDIIKDFSIYKGHVPAQYGGRLSSVFKIITRQGNSKKFMARGGISPIAAILVLEGPLKKDTASFLISARSTYSNWLLGQIKDPDIRNSKASFDDFSGSLNYNLHKTQMSVFAYHSDDHFKLSDINKYTYTNSGLSLNFNHTYNSSLRAEYALIASEYAFTTVDMQEVSSAYEHSYKIRQLEAQADLNQVIGEKHTLEYGISIIRYDLDRGTVNPFGTSSLRAPVLLGKEQAYESSVYVSDLFQIKTWLSLDLGLRYSMYMPTGPKMVYTYLPGAAMEAQNITDSIFFGKNKPLKYYGTPQLRAALNIETDKNGSVKLSFNQMSQNLFMLSNTVAISPDAQWKLSDYHLLPSKSNLVSCGIFRNIARNSLEASVEVFYKTTSHYPEFKDGADFLNNPNLETAVLQGTQKAYGIEFLLKRSARKLEGWLSYTYSRSFVNVNGGQSWNSINNGETYPANHDIPHSLNMVLNYHINRRITFSSLITYQTGKPVTYPVSVYYINGLPYLDYSKRNAYRIPDYFRADASFTLEGNLNKKKLIHSFFTFSVYNATGRDNAYSVFFRTENGNIRSYKYTVIGVPVLTVTWIFKLGNYASE